MGRSALILMLAAALLAASGCGRPAATGKGPESDAVAVLTAYLEARREGDIARAYGYLTDAAKAAYTEQEMSDYYGAVRDFTWGRLGEPKAVAEDWVRIIAYDITARMGDGRLSIEEEHPYYLHKSGGRWSIALVNPMVGRLGRLYAEDATAQAIYDLTQEMLKVNPWSYRAHREQFMLFMGIGDPEAAGGAVENLYKVATPSDLPEINALRGQFYVELADRPIEGRDSLKLALEMGAQYPERYGNTWRSYTMVMLARAHRALGEDDAAKEAAAEAYRLEPANALAREFLAQYGVNVE